MRRLPGLRVFIGHVGEAGEIAEAHRMKRRARRDRQRGGAAVLLKEPCAERDAGFSLAPAGAEARVALQRLDVVVASLDCFLEVLDRHVLAAADERLTHGSPRYSQRASCVSQSVIWSSSGKVGLMRSQIHFASTSLVGFSSPSISLR